MSAVDMFRGPDHIAIFLFTAIAEQESYPLIER
jgi:hypothetical protein